MYFILYFILTENFSVMKFFLLLLECLPTYIEFSFLTLFARNWFMHENSWLKRLLYLKKSSFYNSIFIIDLILIIHYRFNDTPPHHRYIYVYLNISRNPRFFVSIFYQWLMIPTYCAWNPKMIWNETNWTQNHQKLESVQSCWWVRKWERSRRNNHSLVCQGNFKAARSKV